MPPPSLIQGLYHRRGSYAFSRAFNALLKTLEEPPEHVVFILATTEIHKVPQTILSRCQRYDFPQDTVRADGCRFGGHCQEGRIPS